jgi:ketosteroid isomerase-like protein
MRAIHHRLIVVVLVALGGACAGPTPATEGSDDALLRELLALERGALDRWMRLDPDGYLGIYAEDVTYFDATTKQREAGLETLRKTFAPIKEMKAPFSDPRYEFIDPQVQREGDLAVLTFNLLSFGKLADGAEHELARWNTTEVYRRDDTTWKVIHAHWSFVQGQPKPPGS